MGVIFVPDRSEGRMTRLGWKAAAQRSWVCYPFRHGGIGTSAVRRGDRRKREERGEKRVRGRERGEGEQRRRECAAFGVLCGLAARGYCRLR